MKIFGRPQGVLFAGLLIAAPAFAQMPQTQKQTPPAPAHTPQAQNQDTKDSNSPTTAGLDSDASKQKTQGDLPEVGPASGAYKGNVPRSKY
jgi:hypothetical protein